MRMTHRLQSSELLYVGKCSRYLVYNNFATYIYRLNTFTYSELRGIASNTSTYSTESRGSPAAGDRLVSASPGYECIAIGILR
jgi:hypothetical protein